MSYQKSQDNINQYFLNPDSNLTLDEVGEFLKLTSGLSGDELKKKLFENNSLLKLIKNDYFKINLDRLSIYSKYGVNLLSFDNNLIKLGFDLGNSKNQDFISINRFLAIIKLQKTLGIEVNGIINLTLIQNVFPNIFRTRNKLSKELTAEKFSADLKLKIFESEKIQENYSESAVQEHNITSTDLTSLRDNLNEAFDPYELGNFGNNDLVEYEPSLEFKGIGDIYSKGSKVTNCAGINRQTLQENGIKGPWYTAKGGKYNYFNNILDPRTRLTNFFKDEKNITEPKKILLAEDLGIGKPKNLLKSRKGGEINQDLIGDFSQIEETLNNGEIISIIMDSRTNAGKTWGHMATGMMFENKLYVTDPVILKKRDAIEYGEYLKILSKSKIGGKNTFTIKGIIVYDSSHNKNESYIASLNKNNNNHYLTQNNIHNPNPENSGKTYIN